MQKLSSSTNYKIKEILKLKEKHVRLERQQFLVEGQHLVLEALKKGIVLTILGTELALQHNVVQKHLHTVDEVYEISANVAQKLSDVVTSQHIFAVCSMKEQKIDYEHNILLLDQLQDPGNLGTLIRSAASFDFKTIIGSANAVSFYNDKVLRATQGNFFQVNLINEYLIKTINDLKQAGYVILGTNLHQNSKKLEKVRFNDKDKYALIIGNEAKGISFELLDMIDININVEMDDQVESLNAAIAGSIIMHKIYVDNA
ncbi:RNA methyltransferase, TrmH family [Williamsoniiplasma luminosum]|uniref:RNA methyltransferase n=1 Tax=Williamsoniiplasma luminosum TaxID=214888 RepID=A0A2K8NWW8_9MOLU|nr:RNA methyltransferase [Williamsoniiplasma luminosum]ATZ17123.1 RNA methyltransferase, TrmH family [Williamsoniiplasma luminosum]AVP49782.1 MAG: RNA methyltransferase [Williamsoniiplasma luminosum]